MVRRHVGCGEGGEKSIGYFFDWCKSKGNQQQKIIQIQDNTQQGDKIQGALPGSCIKTPIFCPLYSSASAFPVSHNVREPSFQSVFFSLIASGTDPDHFPLIYWKWSHFSQYIDIFRIEEISLVKCGKCLSEGLINPGNGTFRSYILNVFWGSIPLHPPRTLYLWQSHFQKNHNFSWIHTWSYSSIIPVNLQVFLTITYKLKVDNYHNLIIIIMHANVHGYYFYSKEIFVLTLILIYDIYC